MPDNTFKNLGEGTSISEIVEYLTYVATLKFTKDYVRDSIEALDLQTGDTLAELGCGVAHDASSLCAAVSPGGRVIFIDKDEAILEVAKAGSQTLDEGFDAQFLLSDVTSLDIRDSSVDGARIIRTLQHVADPRQAISEILRIVRPGKRIVSIEPDWSTFVVGPSESESAILRDQISSGILSPHVGACVAYHLRDLGATKVHSTTRKLGLKTFTEAEKVFLLGDKLRKAESAGLLSNEVAQRWRAAAVDATQSGNFSCSVDLTFVTAEK